MSAALGNYVSDNPSDLGNFMSADTHFSLSTGMNPSIRAAIAEIADTAWTPIRYPHAIEDPDTDELISEAEVAEVPYTAFTGKPKAQQVTARLIVRRVVDRAKPAVEGEQGELFPSEGRCARGPFFHANAAWITLWAITHNLVRAAGCLASVFHAKATTATLRAHLICVPANSKLTETLA